MRLEARELDLRDLVLDELFQFPSAFLLNVEHE